MNGLYIQKKKKKNPLKRLVGLLIILLLFALLFKSCQYSFHMITSMKVFKIKEISIITPPNIPKERILGLTGISNKTGLYEIPLKELKQRIRRDPWVKRVKIWRTIPSKIEITISSKEVVALAKMNDSIYYIDDTGTVVDKLIVGYKNDLPIITVPSGKYMEAISVMDKLKPLGEISELVLDDQILTAYTASTSFKLHMANLDTGIELIKKVLLDLEQRHEVPAGIDATLPGNKVVVRGLRKL